MNVWFILLSQDTEVVENVRYSPTRSFDFCCIPREGFFVGVAASQDQPLVSAQGSAPEGS